MNVHGQWYLPWMAAAASPSGVAPIQPTMAASVAQPQVGTMAMAAQQQQYLMQQQVLLNKFLAAGGQQPQPQPQQQQQQPNQLSYMNFGGLIHPALLGPTAAFMGLNALPSQSLGMASPMQNQQQQPLSKAPLLRTPMYMKVRLQIFDGNKSSVVVSSSSKITKVGCVMRGTP